MSKETTGIPKGPYCYDKNGVCPYYEKLGTIVWRDVPQDGELKCTYSEGCEARCEGCMTTVVRCAYLDLTDFDEDTLLWDQVSECSFCSPDCLPKEW